MNQSIRIYKHHHLDAERLTCSPATLFSRFCAFTIDSLLFNSLFQGFSVMVSATMPNSESDTVIVGLGWLAIGTACFTLPIYFWGSTFGKKTLGLKVVDMQTGGSPNLFKTLVRMHIGFPISVFLFFLGYFVAVFSSQKLTFHDRLSGTRVIQEDLP
ncbi:MAG: RDD family protein [Proteobacteria bacterium]|nr:RDD family protein [Pseudomonadota bacterium]NDC24482.1 RDD family protein [Pseudomonadota bacterium]NDD04804.1 RDD family protein [Pseudomonadota bacterium]NDG27243.1 RDD family protein [Pseudomonadota bacterium]